MKQVTHHFTSTLDSGKTGVSLFRFSVGLTAFFPLISLLGWIAHIEKLTSFANGFPATAPNTAIMLLCSIGSLIFQTEFRAQRHVKFAGRLLAIYTMAIAFTTLAEYAIGHAIHFPIVYHFKESPSPEAAGTMILAAGALLLASIQNGLCITLFQGLSLSIGAISEFFMIGYLTQSSVMFSKFTRISAVGISIPTMLSLLFLSFALLSSQPRQGFMALAFGKSAGGIVLRRLSWIAIALPCALVVFLRITRSLGLHDEAIEDAFAIMFTIIVFFLFTWSVAKKLEYLDSQRKSQESDLQKWKTIFENAGWGIVIAEVGKNTIGLMNPAYIRMHGYDRSEELFGRPIPEVFAPENRDELPSHIEKAYQFGHHTFESMHLRKDGSRFPVLIDISLIRDKSGLPTHRVINIRDITLEKRAEQKQKIRREFLESISLTLNESLDFEGTIQKIAQLSVMGFSDWCIIDILESSTSPSKNYAFHRDPNKKIQLENYRSLYPATPQTYLSAYLTIDGQKPNLVTDVDIQKLKRLAFSEGRIKAILDLGLQSYILCPLMVRNRRIGAISFMASEQNFEPSDAYFAQEIANRAALSIENARLFLEAKSATRAREDTLAIVTHDLRNPVASIKLNIDIFNRNTLPILDLSPEKMAKIEKQVLNIKRAASRAEQLISDLLDYTRIEKGNLRLVQKTENINDIFEELQATFSPIAQEHMIQLVVSTQDVNQVYCDRLRILQTLGNLVSNAIKFSAPGGIVEIRAKPLNQHQVLFSVKDYGHGMDTETIEHIFERYWQPEHTKSQGTGLGLSIVKGIVEAHGGKVCAESAVGKGSTFYFSLSMAVTAVSGLTLLPSSFQAKAPPASGNGISQQND